MGYLGKTNRNLFKIPYRYKYEIINSTNIVHFKTLDGRSEGDKEEIDLKKYRVRKEINNCKKLGYIVLFGKKAKLLKNFLDELNKKRSKKYNIFET